MCQQMYLTTGTVHYQQLYTNCTTTCKRCGKSRASCIKYRIRERQMAFNLKLNAKYPVHKYVQVCPYCAQFCQKTNVCICSTLGLERMNVI